MTDRGSAIHVCHDKRPAMGISIEFQFALCFYSEEMKVINSVPPWSSFRVEGNSDSCECVPVVVTENEPVIVIY